MIIYDDVYAPRMIISTQVPCRYCHAKVGEPCTKWRRGKFGKFLKQRGQSHPDRKYDAQLATEAVRALNPG